MQVEIFEIVIGEEMDAMKKINTWFSKFHRGIDVKMTFTTQGHVDSGGVGRTWLWVLYETKSLG